MLDRMMLDPRPEGLYCSWETLSAPFDVYELVIERVSGDCSVTRFSCTRTEAMAIVRFLMRPIAWRFLRWIGAVRLPDHVLAGYQPAETGRTDRNGRIS